MKSHIKDKAKKFIVLGLLAMALILFLGFNLNQENVYRVSLNLDNKVIDVVTGAITVEELLLNEDILLEEGADINVSPETELEDNMSIVINRPKTYTISIDDKEFHLKSTHSTVEEIGRASCRERV